ncbi:MAG: trigger factor [Betaproteobacteria bacterium]|jgi:trigger factor|nr:trigger factor [Betaproteobacteria bacterium]
MQNTIENLSALERRLTMAVPVAEIDKRVDERLKKIARTVRMAGFRPGKVPLKVVAQQYGPQVRSEVISDAVEKAFTDAVQGQNLRVAGYPRIEHKDSGEEGNLEFSATFEIYPEIQLGDLSAIRVERPALTVGDAEVDKTIEALRKQRKQFDVVDTAGAAGDRVTIDFEGTIDGQPFAGGKGENAVFVLGEGRMLADLEAGVIGMKAGESKTITVKFPDDYHGKEVAGKAAAFAIKVNKVEHGRLPEVDADFAKSLGVADGDIAKMRAEIKSNVEREVKQRLGARLKTHVMQALLDATKVDLPKSLVDMEAQRLVSAAAEDLKARGLKLEDMPIGPQMFEEQARRRVALGLIMGECIRKHDLGAKPQQVRALVEEQAESYEQPGEVVKWFYSQPERLAEFEGLAVEQNVLDWVLKQAKVEDQTVSFDELMGGAS